MNYMMRSIFYENIKFINKITEIHIIYEFIVIYSLTLQKAFIVRGKIFPTVT